MITKLFVFTLLASANFSAATLNHGSFDVVRTQGGNHEALRRMLANLQSNDPFVRVKAAQELGDLKDSQTVAALICALKDENLYVRAYSAEALGKLHNSKALQPLIKTLNDEKFFVRVHAVKAMGELRDPKAVNCLLALLQGESDEIKPYAAWALGEIKDKGSIKPLIEALKDETCCEPVAGALQKITQQDYGTNYEQWNTWWLTIHW